MLDDAEIRNQYEGRFENQTKELTEIGKNLEERKETDESPAVATATAENKVQQLHKDLKAFKSLRVRNG